MHLGNLEPTRDLTFVKDTCKGFLEIFKSEKLFGEITNIGMNEEISMGNLVNMIIKTLNLQVKLKTEEQRVRPENSEVERLMCNNNKTNQQY